MDKEKSYFSIVLGKTEYIFALIAGFFVIATMILVSVDVFLRNFFNSPIPGVYEVVGFLFVSAVALGFPYTQAQKANININVATRYLSLKFQKGLVSIGYIIAIFVVVIIAWQSALAAWSSFVVQDYTMGLIRFPLWPAKTILTLGLWVLLIRLIYDLFSLINDKKFKEDNY